MHAQSFNDLLSERELLVCVGPGGVGKTTCAAALGLGSAQLGYRTLVLTIDPARRLASMLGLSGLDDTDREVPLTDTPGTLHAAMLDTGSSYDALIHRVSPDPEHREQIYNNRIYQLMSRTFGASHAYVAMERLHSAIASGAYERIILDTPPTRNALDILDAPGRLSTFLDEGALQWFVNAPSGGLRQRLMARGGVAAGRLLQLLTGQGLVDELREFLAVFMVLRQGFRQRAEAISARLRAPQTGFVLVTSPQAGNLEDAAYLHQGLASRGIATQAVVCNRA
ncbi:MAG: ArsA family ATPase, partial [Nannocystaceae bacterium]